MNKNIQAILLFAGIALFGGIAAYKMIHIPKQAELVVLVSILMLYPIFRFPIIGLYTAFFIAPFIPFVRRLYYLVHGRPGIDPLIMVTDILVVVVFVGLFFELREHLREREHESGPFLTMVTVYLAYMVVRTFVYNSLPYSDSAARLKYYAPSVLLFFIGFVITQKFSHFKTLWSATLVIGIAASLYGLKQLYIGYSRAEKIWFSSIDFSTLFIKGVARPFSFFQAPAAFADFLVLGIIAALMMASWGKAKGKLLAIGAVPLLFYGVLITSVRSSWIGALSVFFFWFVFVKVNNFGTRIVIIAAAVGVFFTYQLMDDMVTTGVGIKGVTGLVSGASTNQSYMELLVTTRTSAITNPFEEHSLLSRIALWSFIFDSSLDLERGLLGRGLGSLNADSLYMTYLAEFGYPGMLFIIFLVLAFIVRGLKSLETLSDPRVIILTKGIVVMNMALALMNITGSHIHSFPGDMYFWFFNGVLMNVHQIDAILVEKRQET
jgi:hypothetical protein